MVVNYVGTTILLMFLSIKRSIDLMACRSAQYICEDKLRITLLGQAWDFEWLNDKLWMSIFQWINFTVFNIRVDFEWRFIIGLLFNKLLIDFERVNRPKQVLQSWKSCILNSCWCHSTVTCCLILDIEI